MSEISKALRAEAEMLKEDFDNGSRSGTISLFDVIDMLMRVADRLDPEKIAQQSCGRPWTVEEILAREG